MSESAKPVALLSRSLDQIGSLIAATRADQMSLPTPCGGWNVADLIAHIVDDLAQFAARATGATPGWTASSTTAGPDRVSAFRRGAVDLLDAWRRDGDLEGIVQLPGMGDVPARFPVDQQITEFAVHAWDLARSTGMSIDLDTEIGDAALNWARGALRPEFRGDEASGKAFGLEFPVPAEAPIYDRLAGFFGRRPNWSAANTDDGSPQA